MFLGGPKRTNHKISKFMCAENKNFIDSVLTENMQIVLNENMQIPCTGIPENKTLIFCVL